MQCPFYPLYSHAHASPPEHQHVRAARPRWVHLLQPEYIMHLIGVLQLREREGVGGGTELLKITSVHFAHCQY